MKSQQYHKGKGCDRKEEGGVVAVGGVVLIEEEEERWGVGVRVNSDDVIVRGDGDSKFKVKAVRRKWDKKIF